MISKFKINAYGQFICAVCGYFAMKKKQWLSREYYLSCRHCNHEEKYPPIKAVK